MLTITFPSCPLLVSETLNFGAQLFSQKGFANPRLNAERLLGQILGLTRTNLYLNYDRPVNKTELSQYSESLQRRLDHEPLQYILGEAEFMSLPFQVNPHVLIPRPETEILVETVLTHMEQVLLDFEEISILDLGTGSGCIVVSLAKNLPQAQFVAWDISTAALQIARQNAEKNGVREKIEFQHVDFFDPAILKDYSCEFDVVVSNPPYIALRDFQKLPAEVKDFEPAIALKDSDGLGFFRRLADVALSITRPGAYIAVEVGLGQADEVKQLFEARGLADTVVRPDLNRIDRVVSCRVPAA